MKSGKLVTRALREDFHAAIMIIANPAGDPEDVRLPFHKPAKANTLNASANDEAAGLNRLFG